MTTDRDRRVSTLFAEVRGLNTEERKKLLDQQCGDDSELRAEVEPLLAHERAAADVFDRPAIDQFVAETRGESREAGAGHPDRIGDYRIIGVLGVGGMGVVYRAEQENPRQSVALKVIQRGRASDRLLRRFEHEAQVLGRLNHPGIALLFTPPFTPIAK